MDKLCLNADKHNLRTVASLPLSLLVFQNGSFLYILGTFGQILPFVFNNEKTKDTVKPVTTSSSPVMLSFFLFDTEIFCIGHHND